MMPQNILSSKTGKIDAREKRRQGKNLCFTVLYKTFACLLFSRASIFQVLLLKIFCGITFSHFPIFLYIIVYKLGVFKCSRHQFFCGFWKIREIRKKLMHAINWCFTVRDLLFVLIINNHYLNLYFWVRYKISKLEHPIKSSRFVLIYP